MKRTVPNFILLSLLLIFSPVIFAAEITVCASGCNYTTIQAAVNAASSGDVILVNVNGTITASGISISKNLTIRGLGQNTTIIQANASRGVATSRVMYISSGVTVTLEGFTIQHGRETATTVMNGSGCGILIDGTGTTVTMNNVTVKNNDTGVSGSSGAGLTLAGTSSNLSVNNCRIEGNISGSNSAGGLYLSASPGTFTAKNTVIDGNIGQGVGGVFISSAVTVTFSNCLFNNNQAAGAGNSSGAVYAASAIPNFNSCTFTNNTAANFGGAMRIGGANITNCTFYNNSALQGGAISRGTGSAGNALYIVNSTFYGNSATGASPAGAGLANSSTTALIHMVNTVLSNSAAGSDVYLNTATTLSTNQKNYVGTASFTTGSTTFAYNSGANFSGSLANNGGLTSTMAINAGSALIDNGASPVTGVSIPSKDQRNYVRSGTLDIGAYEYSGSQTLAVNYSTLPSTLMTTNRTLNSTITDNVGLPTSGTLLPRIYFKKGVNGNWNSTAGTLTSGTAQSGTWDFTVNNTLMGGVAVGDQVYYFLAVQDNTAGAIVQSNPAGVSAADVNNIGTSPGTLNSYSISAAMPVKITSFDVKKIAVGKALLSWKMDPLEQAQDYEVWRSNDGIQFQRIAIIRVNAQAKYSYADDQLLSGTNYYRLRMIETSGAVTFSKTIFVSNKETGFEVISIKPVNSSRNTSLQVEFYSAINTNIQIVITDAVGRKLVQKHYKAGIGNTILSLPVDQLRTGTHYIQIIPSGKMASKAVPFVKY